MCSDIIGWGFCQGWRTGWIYLPSAIVLSFPIILTDSCIFLSPISIQQTLKDGAEACTGGAQLRITVRWCFSVDWWCSTVYQWCCRNEIINIGKSYIFTIYYTTKGGIKMESLIKVRSTPREMDDMFDMPI